MRHASVFVTAVRSMRSLRLASVVFAAFCASLTIPLPAVALMPPAPRQVTDKDALRLLKTAYQGETVNLASEWSAMQASSNEDSSEPVGVSRNVCADSGRDAYGPRMIAVCTSFDEAGHATPGLVDLWLLLDPRNDRPARIGASKRNIPTGGFGMPGAVSFFAVGPARTAFALESGYSNMGWSSNVRTLYFAESDQFDELLSLGTHIDNDGACDPNEDKACLKRLISIDCALRADTAEVDGGFYALRVEVEGERGGRPVDSTIAIPRESGAYVVPEARLAKVGCDQGG